MATIFAPPLITRIWRADSRVAIAAQADVGRTYIGLFGQDRFFGGPGVGPDYDWPNPRAPGRLAPDVGVSALALSQGAPPFVQSDWPNPRGPASAVAVRVGTEPLKLQLLGQDAFFSGPGVGPDYDWPNPLRPRPPAHEAGTRLLGLYIQPFRQTEHPNPLRAIQPIALKTWTEPLKLNLLGQDRFFGGAGVGPDYDWPNPQRPRPPAHPVGERILGLYIQPFRQADWPVPRGYTPAQTLKTWTASVNLELLGQDAFFGGPGVGPDYDWPNPLRARHVLHPPGAPAPQRPPGANYDVAWSLDANAALTADAAAQAAAAGQAAAAATATGDAAAQRQGAGALGGSATLSVSLTGAVLGSLAIGSAAGLSSAATRQTTGDTVLSASAAISAAAAGQGLGTSTLSAGAALALAASAQGLAASPLGAAGALTSAALSGQGGASGLATTAALSGALVSAQAASTALIASPALSGTASLGAQVSAGIAAVAGIVAGAVTGIAAAVALTIGAALSGIARTGASVTASLAASAALFGEGLAARLRRIARAIRYRV